MLFACSDDARPNSRRLSDCSECGWVWERGDVAVWYGWLCQVQPNGRTQLDQFWREVNKAKPSPKHQPQAPQVPGKVGLNGQLSSYLGS